MSVRIVQERLDRYVCRSRQEEDHALREITQEILLAGLGRSDFFEHAGFHGGTCLRIFHGLNRFSEDMDFALQKPDTDFSLKSYLIVATDELLAYGYQFEIDDRDRMDRTVRKAFLKDDSIGGLLRLQYRPLTGPLRKLRIKVEVDTNPPDGATYTMPILDFPFVSAVRVFDPPSLFAGKIHALLCREYEKGRDWYDFLWYTAQQTSVNYRLLDASLNQTGPWAGQGVMTGNEWCMRQIQAKIDTLDVDRLRADVQPFVKPSEQRSLALWSRDLFTNQNQKLRFKPLIADGFDSTAFEAKPLT